MQFIGHTWAPRDVLLVALLITDLHYRRDEVVLSIIVLKHNYDQTHVYTEFFLSLSFL